MNKNFSKMDLILFIKLFTLICPPIGILLNLLVIWLILVKTPKEMLKYSRILLQTCIFDIVFLLHEIIGIQLPISDDNMVFGIYCSYFSVDFYHLFGPFGLFVLTYINTFLYGFDIMLIVFQFIYRYFLFNRNTQISLFRYLQFVFLLLILNIIFISILLAKFHESILHCRPEELEYLKSINMVEESCYVIVDKKLLKFIRYFWSWLILALIIFYSIIIILRWRIIKFVNIYGGFSEMTHKLNKQLTRTLTLLAAFPFLTFCFIMIFYAIFFLSGIGMDNKEKLSQLQQIGIIFVYITPILNPIITILINTPYRNAIVRLFYRKSQQQIAPIPLSIQT